MRSISVIEDNKINKHPEYTSSDLEDFQFMGLNWLVYLWSKGENGILADNSGKLLRQWCSFVLVPRAGLVQPLPGEHAALNNHGARRAWGKHEERVEGLDGGDGDEAGGGGGTEQACPTPTPLLTSLVHRHLACKTTCVGAEAVAEGYYILQDDFYKNILTKNFQGLVKSANGISLLNICGSPLYFAGADMPGSHGAQKAANHPYLFNSAKIHMEHQRYTQKLLARLKQDWHRVLILSHIVCILNILSDLCGYLHQRL
ncbi:hypothetical protein B0H13DRAFT_2381913 [Mycena leptocephala]|nr:hypothetical protein B0H13DRAFT_2381913 [Mycena leptocephala]